MKRTFSLSALTVLDIAPPEAVSCAAQAGYDAVGLRLIPATGEERNWGMLGDTAAVRATRHRLEETGLHVLDVEIVRIHERTRSEDFTIFLETGAYLGATQMLVAGMDPEPGRLAENLAALGEAAAPYGITPNLEFMPWTGVPDLATAARVLQDAGHENLGLLVDMIHWARGENSPAMLDPLPREWFNYVQLCDAPAPMPATTAELIHQARNARLLPGEGGLDLLGPLQRLPRDLPISLEIPFEEHLRIPPSQRASKALETARRLMASIDHGEHDTEAGA